MSERERIDTEVLAPTAYKAMLRLNAEVHQLGLDPLLVELVKVRVSQINGCAFCLDMHTKDARALGETEMRLYVLPARREASFYTPRERAALALAEAMTLLPHGGVSDEVYGEAAKAFPPEELAGLIWAIAVINIWNRIAVTTRDEPGIYQSAHRPPSPA